MMMTLNPAFDKEIAFQKINISSKRSGNGLAARLVGNVVFNIFQLVAVFRGVSDFQESFLILTTLQSEVGGVMD